MSKTYTKKWTDAEGVTRYYKDEDARSSIETLNGASSVSGSVDNKISTAITNLGLGTAAVKDSTSLITSGSTGLIESGPVYTKTNAIDENMGTVELGDTAANSHAVGEYFIWKSQFVKVTSAIGVGDTISTTTHDDVVQNVATTSIAAILSQLNSDIDTLADKFMIFYSDSTPETFTFNVSSTSLRSYFVIGFARSTSSDTRSGTCILKWINNSEIVVDNKVSFTGLQTVSYDNNTKLLSITLTERMSVCLISI